MLHIGYVQFNGLAAPEYWPFGGEQKIAVRELPGGAIFYQLRGDFPTTEHSWEGSFTADDALQKAELVDGYRASGESVEVTFHTYTLFYFVEKFVWKWVRESWIDFSITLRRDFSKKTEVAASGPVETALASASTETTPAETSTEKAPVDQTTYVVVSGDSLWRIGQQYGISVDDLYAANKSVIGSNPSMIQPGMELVIKT